MEQVGQPYLNILIEKSQTGCVIPHHFPPERIFRYRPQYADFSANYFLVHYVHLHGILFVVLYVQHTIFVQKRK